MTREEGINILYGLKADNLNLDDAYTKDKYEALKMAIEALEQEHCEDAISRQAVMDALCNDCELLRNGEQTCFTKCEEYHFLATLPPVNPQPKTGHWLHRENMDYLDKNKVIHNHFMCQNCGFIHDFIDGHTAQYKYCPNCGAMMVEPQESEE